MADQPVVHIGENSPEKIAFTLMREIASCEGVTFSQRPSDGRRAATREWILNTYAQCRRATKGVGAQEDDGDPEEWLKSSRRG